MSLSMALIDEHLVVEAAINYFAPTGWLYG